mgnify:CR=1 FL=1
MQSPPVKRAVISVSDKAGLADFGRGLAEAGVEIYSCLYGYGALQRTPPPREALPRFGELLDQCYRAHGVVLLGYLLGSIPFALLWRRMRLRRALDGLPLAEAYRAAQG